jgi:hypothetical protein
MNTFNSDAFLAPHPSLSPQGRGMGEGITEKTYIMNRDEMISTLKTYFQSRSDVFNIDMAFLYGSWARVFQRKFRTLMLLWY